jgi:hypothetical protein
MDAATIAMVALPKNTIDNEQQQQQELNDPVVITNPTAVDLPPQMTHGRCNQSSRPNQHKQIQGMPPESPSTSHKE